LDSLILVVNVVRELKPKRTAAGIARFPCGSTAFLFLSIKTITFSYQVYSHGGPSSERYVTLLLLYIS